eukprot:m.131777 g.131777  ORF g.131777 m.131777 type:complete len:52 (+) comp38051_c0_seq26:1952-2107(+)
MTSIKGCCFVTCMKGSETSIPYTSQLAHMMVVATDRENDMDLVDLVRTTKA